MKRLFTFAATIVLILLATITKAQQSADSTAILAILQEEVTSWNNGDAATYSQHFAGNGTFTNIRGMFFTGHQEFLDRHVEIFKRMFAKTILQQQVVSFRFVTPEVAIVETLTWITGFPKGGAPKAIYLDDKKRLHTRLLQVFQKRADDWQIIVYHNVDLKPGTPVPAHK